ncbi:DinB family protein [Blastococcus sp. SYSU D00669]
METLLDEQGRPEPPADGDELATLLGFLEFQRATLVWKTDGLDADGFRARVGASTMTLGGLLTHLAWVEDSWFTWRLWQRDPGAPWNAVDWEAEPDRDWERAADLSPDEVREVWRAAVERSRERVAEALADGGLDRPLAVPWPDGRAPSLRWLLVHMIEEYARHNGHADLIRETIDGATGE